jgi:hypothetical protein
MVQEPGLSWLFVTDVAGFLDVRDRLARRPGCLGQTGQDSWLFVTDFAKSVTNSQESCQIYHKTARNPAKSITNSQESCHVCNKQPGKPWFLQQRANTVK